MNVHWSEAALADADAIRATITRRSERYATAMVRALFDRTAILADQPRIGPVVPEFDDPDVRELFEHPYRIIYRVLESQVDVLAVVHAARRLPRGLAGGS